MSLITVSSESAELLHQSRGTRAARASSSVSRASSVMPRMPFMGVRISWLMLARNSLLARLAASAASLARCSSASACFRAVTSSQTPRTQRPRPSTWIGTLVVCSHRVRPLVVRGCSAMNTVSPLSIARWSASRKRSTSTWGSPGLAHLLVGYADHLLCGQSVDIRDGLVGQDPDPVAVLDEDERGARVDHRLEQRVMCAEGRLSALALGRLPAKPFVHVGQLARARGDQPLDPGSAAGRRDHPAGAERRGEQAHGHERPREVPMGSIRLPPRPIAQSTDGQRIPIPSARTIPAPIRAARVRIIPPTSSARCFGYLAPVAAAVSGAPWRIASPGARFHATGADTEPSGDVMDSGGGQDITKSSRESDDPWWVGGGLGVDPLGMLAARVDTDTGRLRLEHHGSESAARPRG